MIAVRPKSVDVYVSAAAVFTFGREEMAFLTEKVELTIRKRRRLCVHKDDNDLLHEMFVAYCSETYMRPNKHPKDESLHILAGYGDFFIFDHDGNVQDVIALSSTEQVYIRVPHNVYHKMIIRSPVMVIHETIAGPFLGPGRTTIPAPWSPEEFSADIPAYHAELNAIAAADYRRIA